MRSTRLSHETANVATALSASSRTGIRRSLRKFTYPGGSDLSDVKGDTLRGDENAGNDGNTTLGKRKRKHDTATTSKILEKTTASPSPHQEPTTNNSPSTLQRKARRQPAKTIKGPNGTLTVTPPTNWEEIYNATVTMRKRIIAPVDTMGCESLAETHRSPRDQRLQTLISLMLSSQTKDTVTAAAMKNMQENMPGGLRLESLLEIEAEALNKLIEKVGFHNNKTKYIKAVAVILRDQYGGDIPDTIEGLVSLPGVGPKMAYLCMSAAWGRDEGIGVDVHVHRITNLWRWHKTSTPEQTRAELEAWLPKDKWHEINHLLVGLGQTICLPVGRKCGECDLAAKKLCPSAVVGKSPATKKVERKVEVENGNFVKKEEVVVLADDVGIKVEADLEDEGKIEAHDPVGLNSNT